MGVSLMCVFYFFKAPDAVLLFISIGNYKEMLLFKAICFITTIGLFGLLSILTSKIFTVR